MIRLCTHSLLILLVGTATAGDSEAPPPDFDTLRRAPAARTIPFAPRLRFEPRADMTAHELEQLGPYLKGKPLHEEDRKTLGPAMRHLREIN